jgi:hypothetical protein
MPSQIHPEVCFANLLEASQSNQLGSRLTITPLYKGSVNPVSFLLYIIISMQLIRCIATLTILSHPTCVLSYHVLYLLKVVFTHKSMVQPPLIFHSYLFYVSIYFKWVCKYCASYIVLTKDKDPFLLVFDMPM